MARCDAELDDLEDLIIQWAARVNAATAHWLSLVIEFDARRGWQRWECTSCVQWLNWKCGLSPRAAREHLRVGHALAQLPILRAAFARGELSYSKVRALTRFATTETDAELVALAPYATAAQLDRLAGHHGRVARVPGEDEAATRDRRHHLHAFWDDDDMLVLRGRLRPEDGALVLAALEAAVRRPAGEVAGQEPATRRADALVELVHCAVTAPDAGPAAPAVEVVLHVDHDSLHPEAPDDHEADDHEADDRGDRAGRCHLEDGPALSSGTARRLACDATTRTERTRHGTVHDSGRRTRRINRGLRRALHARDGGCRYPGCTHRTVHAHHLVHWLDGGPTTLANLISLCGFHHRRVHEHRLTLELDAHGTLTVVDEDGHRRHTHAPLPTTTTHDISAAQRHLAITARTAASRWHGDHLDHDLALTSLLHRRMTPAPTLTRAP